MEFNIRFEKLVGIALVVLVPCLWVALSIQSYDLSQEGWSSELTRMGGIGAGESAGTVILQFAAGMGLVLAGAALAVTLRTRAPMAGALSGALIGASGLLVLAASALYGATANLARDYVETGGGPSTLETTRALMLGVGGLTIAAFIAAGIGVYTMAAVAAQKRLVPRALGWIAAVSAVSVVAAIVTDPFTDSSWLFFILGAFTMLIWLLLAGGMLVFGKHTLTPGTAVTAPA